MWATPYVLLQPVVRLHLGVTIQRGGEYPTKPYLGRSLLGVVRVVFFRWRWLL